MTIYVFGGSNTLRKEGWSAVLAGKLPAGSLVNRSVGAATSLMAIFRLLTNTDSGPQAGDTVVWEYALNEANHVKWGFGADVLLRNFERFVRECARRELKVAAAIFTPRDEELAGSRMPLYDELHRLLTHYGIASFDVSTAWRAAKGVAHLDAKLFADKLHYGDDAELGSFIADGVISAIEAATVPASVEPVFAEPGRLDVQIFEDGPLFENTIISLPVAPHGSSMELDVRGRVLGVAALVHPNSRSALRLELVRQGHAGSWVNISTAGVMAENRTILKVFSLEVALGETWEVQPGDRLDVLPMRTLGSLYAEPRARPALQKLDSAPPTSFIGLVLEVLD